MTLQSDPATSLDTAENEDAEKRMRRALGLDRSSPAPARRQPMEQTRRQPMEQTGAQDHGHHQAKRRFVRDGEVPVVVLHGRRDPGLHDAGHKGPPGGSRFEIAEAALRVEQEARETAERALAEVTAQLRELRTKLGHATLSGDEARAALQRMEAERQAEQAAHQATTVLLEQACAARAAAEDALRAHLAVIAAAAAQAAQPERAKTERVPVERVKPARTPRPKQASKAEPKPVKWWLKSKA